MLLFESFVEFRAWKGNENAYHCRYNPARLDKFDLGVENRRGVVVEANNESALHLDAGFLDIPDTGQEIAVLVLEFAAFLQALLMRGLDADEDDIESCPDHHLHEVFIIGQFYGCLRIKSEGLLSPVQPFDDGRENLRLQLFLVPDKIVINKEDLASEP